MHKRRAIKVGNKDDGYLIDEHGQVIKGSKVNWGRKCKVGQLRVKIHMPKWAQPTLIISHGVFRNLGPFDDAMGGGRGMGALDDAMLNGTPFRGYHFDDMIRKLEALDGAMENLGPFALWWSNGEIGNP